MEDGLAIVLSAVKTKNSSTSGHLYITKHERQGKKQRKRERNRGRGGKQGCRGDQRGGREHTRRTDRWSTEAGEQVRTGRSYRCGADGPLVDSSSQEEMQGRTRGRCARPGGLEQGAASLCLRLCRQEAGPPPPPPLFLSSLREAAAARTCGKSPRAGGLPRNSIYAVDSRPFPSSADATRSIPASFHCVRSIPRPIPSSSRLAAPASATGL